MDVGGRKSGTATACGAVNNLGSRRTEQPRSMDFPGHHRQTWFKMDQLRSFTGYIYDILSFVDANQLVNLGTLVMTRSTILKLRLRNICRRLSADQSGNIALTFALVSVPLLAAIAVSIDYAQLVNSQRHLQDAVDGAAVAAAASLMSGKHTETTVKDYAANFAIAQMSSSLTPTEEAQLKSKLAINVTTATSGSVKTFSIKISGGYTIQLSPFASFAGYKTMPISAVSTTESELVSKNAMSMYVVLDRSGSMAWVTGTVNTTKTSCQNYTQSNWGYYPYLANTSPCYVNKMGALKTASKSLFDELDALEAKDTSDKVVRLGGVSFNDAMQTPQAIAWGTTDMRSYVNNIPAYPTGGTDMTDGMAEAYKALSASSEPTAHTAAGSTTFSKFILLMTDGENTGSSGSWNATLDADTLKTCVDARQAGMTIYAVAFMAPPKGEALLRACAGKSDNYYSANDMDSLIDAFAEIGAKAAKKSTRITN
jgi:Flp pilus assembly protein TadG